MGRLHALHLTEAEMRGLSSLLTTIRNDAASKAHATHSQYYQAVLMRAMADDLLLRVDARIEQIKNKGKTP